MDAKTTATKARYILLQSIVYVAIATTVHSAVVLLADATRRSHSSQGRQVPVRRVLSLLLALIAIWLFERAQPASGSFVSRSPRSTAPSNSARPIMPTRTPPHVTGNCETPRRSINATTSSTDASSATQTGSRDIT